MLEWWQTILVPRNVDGILFSIIERNDEEEDEEEECGM